MEGFNDSHDPLENIKGNHSTVGKIKYVSDFHEMKTEIGEDVERFSKKQHFVSLLASMIVPIASIGIKEEKYYSELVQNHESYNELNNKTPLYALVQYVLFRDTDKPGFDRPNIEGGVSFDFDYARFEKEDLPTYAMRLPLTLEKLHSVSKEDIAAMVYTVERFEEQISREEGKYFIEKVIEKTGYKIFSPEEIQEVLLKRVQELKSILNKEL